MGADIGNSVFLPMTLLKKKKREREREFEDPLEVELVAVLRC